MQAQQSPIARVLVVDDEGALMSALVNTLNDQGYEAVGFTRATEALARLRERKFDLLLSDLMMPEMDGIATLRAALEIDPEMVAIIMTGAGTISTAVEAMKTGAFDYVLKPFKLNAILPVFSRALALRDLRVRNAALERKVRQRTVQLESVNKELEAFAYTVSHDLRAPLRHISGFSAFLSSSKSSTLSPTDRDYIDRIKQSAERMGKLIEELLTFARMGEVTARPIPLDADSLIDEILRNMEPELTARNIVWKRDPLPPFYGDPGLIRQVFVNLLMNSVKYTRKKEQAVIEIGCHSDTPEEVVIFVRDNGAGFDMSYADKLFGVFQRLHRQEDFEGTGVGLASVRRIIGRHGGKTWAEGKLDEGATFYFSLPKKPPGESIFDSPADGSATAAAPASRP